MNTFRRKDSDSLTYNEKQRKDAAYAQENKLGACLLCLQDGVFTQASVPPTISVLRATERVHRPAFGPVVKVTVYKIFGLALGSATHIDYILSIHSSTLSPLVSHKQSNLILFYIYRRPSGDFIDMFFRNF